MVKTSKKEVGSKEEADGFENIVRFQPVDREADQLINQELMRMQVDQ